ncbi:MAG TPA: PqiC family protein [Kofleriaceae bacterium]
MIVCCAACSLGGKPPSYQYYVLTSRPASPAAPHVEPGAASRTLAIEEVRIPGYLDREQIATRTAGQGLLYSTTDRWAEPLDKAVERTLLEDLAVLLIPHGIQVTSQGGRATYELSVDVLRFERSGADRVELWARWVLRSEGRVLDRDECRVQLPMSGGDSNAVAAALSEAVARMATQVGDRVQKADVVAARGRSDG